MTTLDDRLRDLAAHLDAPSGEALAFRVGARVRARRAPSVRRRLVLVFAVLLVLLVALSFVPAVGEWLGVRGVEVHQEAPPPTTAPAVPPSLDLGESSTLRDAARRVGFDPVVPSSLGPPDGVWIDTRALVPIVTFTYADGTLVSEFRAAIADDVVLQKFAGPGVRVERVDVGGPRALWVEGTHAVAVRNGGENFIDDFRTSDSALVVELGAVTARIETGGGRDRALAVARNLVVSAGVGRP